MPKGDGTPIKTPDAKAEIVSGALKEIEMFRTLAPVEKGDYNTCSERVKMLFDHCSESGKIPTVELLCLAVGRSRQTLCDWMNDKNCKNGRIIERAKATINALLTELAVSGAVNPIYVMFSQKCNYGYVEPKQALEVEVKPQYNAAPVSKEDIMAEFGRGFIDKMKGDSLLLPGSGSGETTMQEFELLPPFPNTLNESEE